MHDGMQYDPIQGQGQGHEPFTVKNSSSVCNVCSSSFFLLFFKALAICHEILDVRRTRYEIDFNVVYLWFTNCLCLFM